ncbi:unnamed protein product, partial [Rotaria magnacalcarata]
VNETHIVHEKIQQNLTAADIQLDSQRESDHEEDEEVQHQPDQKLSSDPITIESPHITEQDLHESGSNFEPGTISSHQITERRPITEQV